MWDSVGKWSIFAFFSALLLSPTSLVWGAWGCGDSADEENYVESDCSPSEAGASAIAHAKNLDPSCPPPSKKLGNQCVLNSDLVLTEPLILKAYTKLNCQGHRLLPSGLTAAPNVQSIPPVAIFSARASGVKIQNCVIGSETQPFSYGIMIADSKVDPNWDEGQLALRRNKVVGNEVYAANIAIDLLQTDNSEVKDNNLTIFGNGFGVDMRRAAYDVVSNNFIRRIDSTYWLKTTYPGGAPVLAPTVFSSGIIEGTGPNPTADFTFTVGSETVTVAGIDPSQTAPNHHNFIEDNTIEMTGILGRPASLTGFTINSGIQLEDNVSGTEVRGNSISGDSTNPPALGVFVGGASTAPGFLVNNVLLEGNSVTGGFIRDAIQVFVARNTTLRDNVLSDAGRSGVLLGSFGLESTTVTGNIISDNGINCALPFCTTAASGRGGFSFSRGTGPSNFAAFFGAEISLNDVTDNLRGVGVITLVPYTFPSELSVEGQGNYWGHSSAPGFTAADSSLYPLVKDSNPYCVPVAELDPALLPPTCP